MKILNNYPNYQTNTFKGLSPEYICSQLCKGACCNHSTVMPVSLKRATDRLMGEMFKQGKSVAQNLPIKRSIYSWGIKTLNIDAENLNKQINELIKQLHKETSQDRIIAISQKIDELNIKLESILGNEEVFLPITNPVFQNSPEAAVTSHEPNICMYKDPMTNKCTIYYGLITPEGKTLERPTPCHKVGSEEMPCAWLNPEKLDKIVNSTRSLLAQYGYARLPQEVIMRYIADQQNLNETWAENIYMPYLREHRK